ncbi:hypothetical protein IRJ41_003761 [Triplophysa rosa]|uniref:Uncharacterized protein n=1 Tax=Triplophysa rosa TaxID=992332 RepID=A0A9W7WPY7_TRIRA|nr:hypothetical protein IRJ41_003761 [Triplophysa rosa]
MEQRSACYSPPPCELQSISRFITAHLLLFSSSRNREIAERRNGVSPFLSSFAECQALDDHLCIPGAWISLITRFPWGPQNPCCHGTRVPRQLSQAAGSPRERAGEGPQDGLSLLFQDKYLSD